jgi:hypothetical protein
MFWKGKANQPSIHGFAFDLALNWGDSGIIKQLAAMDGVTSRTIRGSTASIWCPIR